MIIFFRNGVFCGKPQILPHLQRIIETCPGKAADGLFCVVHTHYDSWSAELMDGITENLFTVLSFEYQLSRPWSFHAIFQVLVDVAVCMPCQGDGLFPCPYERSDALHHYRRSEYRTV